MTAIRLSASLTLGQRLAAGSLALMLGLSMIWGVGFAQGLHDTAHDTRHAIGFPCH